VTEATPLRGVVVVLDDDPLIGELLAVVLDRAGYEPVTPGDAEAAYGIVADHPGSVVAAVCDLQLGRANGAEVLCNLREMAPGMRAIVMSGHPESHVQAELERAGTDATVIQKPFRPADLVAAIEH
jgi:DNA-binding response OmpR family regulator